VDISHKSQLVEVMEVKKLIMEMKEMMVVKEEWAD
jgi:hypothetical protein